MAEQHIYLVLASFSLSESHHEELNHKQRSLHSRVNNHYTMSSNLTLTIKANCSNVPGMFHASHIRLLKGFVSFVFKENSQFDFYYRGVYHSLGGVPRQSFDCLDNHVQQENVAVADFLFSALKVVIKEGLRS